jgi:putative hydrolase of the HAD superfamily
MIQAITFDLWNTLFTNKSYSELRIQKFFHFLQERKIFIPFDQFKNAFDAKFHFSEVTFEKIEFHHIYAEERILSVLEELNVNIPQSDVDLLTREFESEILQNLPPLKKGVKKTLQDLAPVYQIGLISNTGVTPGRIINKVLEEYDILQFFEATIYSDETGLFKPHPKMFEIPLKKFNCSPLNAIHVGDLLETDVKGAKDYKMHTIWINDTNHPNSTEILPDFEIKHISEVIQIIQDFS